MAAVVGIAELRLRRPGGYVVQVLAVAALYYGSGRLGLLRELSVENAVFTPIYPPTGVSVAALLILGIGCWPGITLGALGVIVTISPPAPTWSASCSATPPPRCARRSSCTGPASAWT